MNYKFDRYTYYGGWSAYSDGWSNTGSSQATVDGVSSSYIQDSSTGTFSAFGSTISIHQNTYEMGYAVNSNMVQCASFLGTPTVWLTNIYPTYSYNRGPYVDTIVAANGAYPTDGVNGSYWYVRTTPILTQVRVNGAWKNASAMKIKVNNAWKDIAAMKVKVAGAWKTIF